MTVSSFALFWWCFTFPYENMVKTKLQLQYLVMISTVKDVPALCSTAVGPTLPSPVMALLSPLFSDHGWLSAFLFCFVSFCSSEHASLAESINQHHIKNRTLGFLREICFRKIEPLKKIKKMFKSSHFDYLRSPDPSSSHVACFRWSWRCGIQPARRTTTGWGLSPTPTLMSSSCASPSTALTV